VRQSLPEGPPVPDAARLRQPYEDERRFIIRSYLQSAVWDSVGRWRRQY
jgi:hypothetical protein